DESISEYSYNKKRKKAKIKKSVGRPEDPVNNEYIKLGPSEMKLHLALECKNVPDQGQEKLINKALTRFFTCCGIPFWVVESPFFVDLLKNLNAGYMSSDRRTLILDGWMSRLHYSYYAFVIITLDRHQYVHFVQDFSSYSHTGSFISNEIIKIIEEIGPKKFGAVVSDGAAAMQLAKSFVAQKYPHIIPICCIAHHIQLIAADIIKKTSFGSQVLSKCQKFITYFQNSHVPGAQLRDEIKKFLIK
ncbi:19030_t:CDS:2, partial [Cetraspora pellucida]